jgi:hypothetical protein
LVESIVAAAPKIPGWSVLALKPRLGFPVTTRWEAVTIAIADIVFEPLEQATSNDLGIRIYVPGITTESAKDAHNALLRALDHALGERAFSESIQYIEVVPLPSDVSAADHIPLTQLENFINWRRKRQGERNNRQKSGCGQAARLSAVHPDSAQPSARMIAWPKLRNPAAASSLACGHC